MDSSSKLNVPQNPAVPTDIAVSIAVKEPTEEELGKALNQCVRDVLPQVLQGLALATPILAGFQMAASPSGLQGTLPWVALGISVVLALLAAASLRWKMPGRVAQPFASLAAFLVLGYSMVALFLDPRPSQTANLILIVFGSSCVLLSLPWFLSITGTAVMGWAIMGWRHGMGTDWFQFGSLLLIASLVGIFVHRNRLGIWRSWQKVRLEENDRIQGLNRAAWAARQNEEKFRHLSSATFEGIAVHENGTVLIANIALGELFGYEESEIVGNRIQDLIVEEERHRVEEVIRFGNFKPFETTGLKKGGSRIPLELYTKQIPYDERRVWVTAFRDITERRKRDTDNQREKDRLQRQYNRQTALSEVEPAVDLPETLHDLLMKVVQTATLLVPADLGSLMAYWDNKTQCFLVEASTVSGIQPGELLGQESGQDIPLLDAMLNHKEPLVVATVGPDPFRINDLFPRRGINAYAAVPLLEGREVLGVLFTLDSAARQFSLDDREFLAAIAGKAATAIARVRLFEQLRQANRQLEKQSEDLKEKNEALRLERRTTEYTNEKLRESNRKLNRNQEELARSNQQLEAAMTKAVSADRAKTNFLNTMSHELRTPMNGILGMISVLEAAALDAEDREALDAARESAEQLNAIIQDVLVYTQLLSDDDEPTIGPCHVVEMAERAIEKAAARIIKPEVEVLINEAEPLPEILYTDESRLKLILDHLLNNALKFTSHGEVLLSINTVPNKKDTWKFQIYDTGIGIPVEKLEGLFHSFTQADSEHSRTFGGTGLGLALCRKAAQSLGSDISAQSREGQGSVFSFELQAKSKGVAKRPARPEWKGRRVILVHPNDNFRTVQARLLKVWDVDCRGARSAEEAQRILNEANRLGAPFSMVVANETLEDMSGLKLLKILRISPNTHDILPVLLTPKELEDTSIDLCLTKPLTSTRWLQLLDEVWGKEAG